METENVSFVSGKKYLITTSEWFVSPSGNMHRAVFGTVHGIFDAESTLGVKTNRNSTNWYVLIGKMLVSGCQIKYVVQTDTVEITPALSTDERPNPVPLIYVAD